MFFYCLTILGVLLLAQWGSRAVTVIAETTPIVRKHCIIIDAGHGGVDGGATSYSGVLESRYNLEISKRLNDLLQFLGYETKMVRTEDVSIYKTGQSIAQKKVSDLKERVRIVNEAENGLLLSIHQNHYSDAQYHGAQVFYAKTEGSQELAKSIQSAFCATINPGSTREIKKCSGIYLMEHIKHTGVLIECGFLSNPTEDALLKTESYQKKLCCVIGASVSQFLSNT